MGHLGFALFSQEVCDVFFFSKSCGRDVRWVLYRNHQRAKSCLRDDVLTTPHSRG